MLFSYSKLPALVGTARIKQLLRKNACLPRHGMCLTFAGQPICDGANRSKDWSDVVNVLSGKITFFGLAALGWQFIASAGGGC